MLMRSKRGSYGRASELPAVLYGQALAYFGKQERPLAGLSKRASSQRVCVSVTHHQPLFTSIECV